jgi:hypothetical protein
VYDGYINVLEVVSVKHGTDEYEIREHSKRVNYRLMQLSSGRTSEVKNFQSLVKHIGS